MIVRAWDIEVELPTFQCYKHNCMVDEISFRNNYTLFLYFYIINIHNFVQLIKAHACSNLFSFDLYFGHKFRFCGMVIKLCFNAVY